ncbi:MAG: hypothetical protein KGK07_06935, partial [Chloroflexota bacterium]|nr:hypothetical protein [Chloroflexota bacterium]
MLLSNRERLLVVPDRVERDPGAVVPDRQVAGPGDVYGAGAAHAPVRDGAEVADLHAGRRVVAAAPAPPAAGELLLTTGRTLYTSLEGAALHLPDADKLHREECVELHPADAASLRVSDGDEVTLVSDHGELTLRCQVSGRVQEGAAFVPSYYDGGAVNALLPPG